MVAFYLLTLVPVTLIAVAIYRFWACIRRMGHYRELMRRAPHMLALDGVTLFLAVNTLYYAAMGWGLDMSAIHDEPLPTWQNLLVSLVCCFSCMGLSWKN